MGGCHPGFASAARKKKTHVRGALTYTFMRQKEMRTRVRFTTRVRTKLAKLCGSGAAVLVSQGM